MRPPGSSFASRIAVRFFLHFSMRHLPSLPHINGVSQGCPNLLYFATFNARLEPRPLSSAGITRPLQYYGPFRHPIAPFLIVTNLRLVVTTDHAIGFPVLRALPLCTCCHHYPGAATGITHAQSPSRISLPRNGGRVGLRNVLFEACSVFTHVTACTLALPPYSRHASPEASTTLLPPQLLRLLPAGADCRVGLSPTGKAPP